MSLSPSPKKECSKGQNKGDTGNIRDFHIACVLLDPFSDILSNDGDTRGIETVGMSYSLSFNKGRNEGDTSDLRNFCLVNSSLLPNECDIGEPRSVWFLGMPFSLTESIGKNVALWVRSWESEGKSPTNGATFSGGRGR